MNRMNKKILKKIFLTGGNGFIGKNIIEDLGKKYDFLAPTEKELDLTKTEAVYDFLKEKKVEIVLHTANLGGVRKEKENPDAIFINLKMFFNLVRAKDFYKRMIMFGSGAEYDKRRSIINIKENDFDKYVPSDQYGFYKYICSKYAETVDYINHIRLFGVYGKYERYQTRFISNAICRTLFNLPININQNVFFDYLYVKDLVKIIEGFIKRKPKYKFYNIGRGKPIDLSTIANKIILLSGKKIPIIIKKSGLNNQYTCNTSRFLSEFPNFKYTNFDKSLEEMFKYYKASISKISEKSLLKE